MEGIAKSVPQSKPEVVKTKVEQGLPTPEVNNSVLKYFNLNQQEVAKKKELDAIAAWAFDGNKVGEGLVKLRGLERKLGYSGDGDRITKLFNYITVLNNISSTQKAMKEEISAARSKTTQALQVATETAIANISGLKSKLKEARDNLRIAQIQHRTHLSSSTKIIRDKYKTQVADLEQIAKAYQGGK